MSSQILQDNVNLLSRHFHILQRVIKLHILKRCHEGKSSSSLEFVVNSLTLEAKILCTLFLLTFEIFNYNIQNCLVDFGSSINLISLSIENKINAKWRKINAQIIQLDWSLVQDIGDLKNVLIRLSKYDQFHQCINILIAYIPEAYGGFLTRESSSKLQGYFAMDWSHLWLPYKGKNNQILVNIESYMKHTVTPFEGHNKPLDFTDMIFRNFFLETNLGCYEAQLSPIPLDT